MDSGVVMRVWKFERRMRRAGGVSEERFQEHAKVEEGRFLPKVI